MLLALLALMSLPTMAGMLLSNFGEDVNGNEDVGDPSDGFDWPIDGGQQLESDNPIHVQMEEQQSSGSNSLLNGLETPNIPTAEDVTSEYDVVFEMETDEFENLPSPIDDWSQNQLLPIIESTDNGVHFELPESQDGYLYILDADYEEQVEIEGDPATEVFLGENVYFIPSGETFPDQYQWSEDGAVLVNTESFENDDSHFLGIKMLARIDGGSYLTLHDEDNHVGLDHTAEAPKITSNREIIFAHG